MDNKINAYKIIGDTPSIYAEVDETRGEFTLTLLKDNETIKTVTNTIADRHLMYLYRVFIPFPLVIPLRNITLLRFISVRKNSKIISYNHHLLYQSLICQKLRIHYSMMLMIF